ncbi:protein delta homolog 2 isoform X2 [Nematostella vectensis]|uniref:protein delta homolog 2 isoform X2 n=1 Tax=Nematostella vectensis TaxID=45351 RepID=UPI0020774EEE|nr:protein delta homolog 2 isoform X2 [Nematostella vectensis]
MLACFKRLPGVFFPAMFTDHSCFVPAETTTRHIAEKSTIGKCGIDSYTLAGSCIDGVNNYTCLCSVGFKGRLCDERVYKCANDSCFPGVNCTEVPGSVKCGACPAGLSGDGKTCLASTSTSAATTTAPPTTTKEPTTDGSPQFFFFYFH